MPYVKRVLKLLLDMTFLTHDSGSARFKIKSSSYISVHQYTVVYVTWMSFKCWMNNVFYEFFCTLRLVIRYLGWVVESGYVGMTEGSMGGQPLVRIEPQQGLDHVNGLRAGHGEEDLRQRSSFHCGRLFHDGLSIVRTNLLKRKPAISLFKF